MEIPIIALIIAIIVIVLAVKKKAKQQHIIGRLRKTIKSKCGDKEYFSSICNQILFERYGLTSQQLDAYICELPELKEKFLSTMDEIDKISIGNPVFNRQEWLKKRKTYQVDQAASIDGNTIHQSLNEEEYIISTLPILGEYFDLRGRLQTIYRAGWNVFDTRVMIMCGAMDYSVYKEKFCLRKSRSSLGMTEERYKWSEQFVELHFDRIIISSWGGDGCGNGEKEFKKYESIAYDKCYHDFMCVWMRGVSDWDEYSQQLYRDVESFAGMLEVKYSEYKKYVGAERLFFLNSVELPYPNFSNNSSLQLSSEQMTKEECQRLLKLYEDGKLKGKYMGRDMEQFQTEQAATK